MTREELRRKIAANPRFRLLPPSGRGTVVGGPLHSEIEW